MSTELTTMHSRIILNQPCCITSRLLPGAKVGDSTISIEYFVMDEGRRRYRVFIDGPDIEAEDTTLRSGRFSGRFTLLDGLQSFVVFLLAAIEHLKYAREEGEDDDPSSFSAEVLAWAEAHEDDLQMLDCDLNADAMPPALIETVY